MKLRDGGKGNRVITPNSEGERMAVQQLQREQAIRSNPLFGIMEKMKEDMQQLAIQNREITMRLHAVLDFLVDAGILLHQDLDEKGFGIPGTVATRSEATVSPFQALVDKGILDSMPNRGFEAYFVEHSKIAQLLFNLQRGIMVGALKMDRVLEMVRGFNEEEGRIHKIRGEQFGLDQYLNANPDNLPEEEIIALAEEFEMDWERNEDKEEDNQEVAAEAKSEEDNVVHIHRP